MSGVSPAISPTHSAAGSSPMRLTERLTARTLLLGAVMVVTVSLFTGVEQDPDFWWHLRIGRWMVDNGRLPSTDIFTFTVPSHVWTDHEYLTEILMWLVYSTLGLQVLIVLFGLITWAGFWLIYRQVRRQPFVVAGVGLALGAIAGSPIWGPRAQMITFALTCLQLYWLQGYLAGRSRALRFFPLVMVLWANLHGGWVIAFGWLGAALAAEAISWLLDRSQTVHVMHLRFLGTITLLSVLAVAATPHFLSLYPYPFQTEGSVAQQKLIVEWFSPDFHQAFLRPFEAMVFLVIVGFVLKRPSLYEFLLVMLALFLSLQSVRNIALFIAAATPPLINAFSGYWKEISTARGWRFVLPPRPFFAVTTALVLLVVAGATLIRISSSISPARQRSVDASTYPVAAADWLASHPEVGRRMYNQYGWGGYLAYRFYPEPNRRVFIFGEAALMGDPLLNEYEAVQTLEPDWKQILDRYRVDYIVYNQGGALANVLATQPDWKLVYQDSVAVIYVRSSG